MKGAQKIFKIENKEYIYKTNTFHFQFKKKISQLLGYLYDI